MIPSWDYHALALKNWPGWDKADNEEPYHIRLDHIMGDGKSSKELAFEFDDISQGRFYYRDITQSGLPFVNLGKPYQSLFVFQYASDFKRFNDMRNYEDQTQIPLLPRTKRNRRH